MINSYFHEATKHNFENVKIENFVLEKNKFLFKKGDTIDYIYFLSKGELNILKNRQLMWQAQRNEFIGISSFFIGDANYSYTVKACKKSTVYKIPLKDFKEALSQHSSLNNELIKLFCFRINKTLNRVKSQSKLSRKKRLINILIEKAKRYSKNEKIILGYSISDIAELVNVSHHFTKNLLTELQNKKLIKIQENNIEITDYNGLKLVSQMKGVIDTHE